MIRGKKMKLLLLYFYCFFTTTMKYVVDAGSCVEEFDNCVIQRDCCENLNCVTGDWQYTTDSTCLSKKSEQIESRKYTLQQRTLLVIQYYQKVNIIKKKRVSSSSLSSSYSDDNNNNNNNKVVVGIDKTRDEIDTIINKYRTDFPKLVAKLERKYDNIEFDIDLLSEPEGIELREDL